MFVPKIKLFYSYVKIVFLKIRQLKNFSMPEILVSKYYGYIYLKLYRHHNKSSRYVRFSFSQTAKLHNDHNATLLKYLSVTTVTEWENLTYLHDMSHLIFSGFLNRLVKKKNYVITRREKSMHVLVYFKEKKITSYLSNLIADTSNTWKFQIATIHNVFFFLIINCIFILSYNIFKQYWNPATHVRSAVSWLNILAIKF